MNEIILLIMLAIIMIASYFTGRRHNVKRYKTLLIKLNDLQKLYDQLLKLKCTEVPSRNNDKNLSQSYWDKEKDFYDSRKGLK